MKKITLLLMIAISAISYSQNEYLDYKYAITTSVNFKHTFRGSGYMPNISRIEGLSGSFFIMDPLKNQHEISLERISFSNSPYSTFYARTSEVSLGYRYHLNFIKKKNARWIPSLGFGANVFYEGVRSLYPFLEYQGRGTTVGLKHFITPALTFHASKRLFLNLSFPVNFITTQMQFHRSTNSAGEHFKNSRFELDSGLNSLNVRFGIGFKF